MKPALTINALSEKTGADRLAIKKWLRFEGLKPLRTRGTWAWYDEQQALAIILPRARKANQKTAEPNIDPETGLTWAQKLAKEKARETQLKNQQTEREQSEEWMRVEDHHRILALFVGKLEQLPGKAKSQLGLNDRQTTDLRKMLDECRTDAAAEVEKMG